jgi:hypothetical protein
LWHIDPLLGNDRERNKTTAIAKQQPVRNNGSTVGTGVFYGSVQRLYHSTDRVELVQRSGVERVCWWVSELEGSCGSVLMSCCC